MDQIIQIRAHDQSRKISHKSARLVFSGSFSIIRPSSALNSVCSSTPNPWFDWYALLRRRSLTFVFSIS